MLIKSTEGASVVGGDFHCCISTIPGSYFELHLQVNKPPISPELLNKYETCLGRMNSEFSILWLTHFFRICQKHIQIASATTHGGRMRGAQNPTDCSAHANLNHFYLLREDAWKHTWSEVSVFKECCYLKLFFSKYLKEICYTVWISTKLSFVMLWNTIFSGLF